MLGSTRFAVALHVLTVLAYIREHDVELVSSDLIAKSVNTSPVVIRNLLRALKKAKLVHAKEGRRGGVWLAKKPSEISLQEVFSAVESGGLLASNDKPSFKPCPVSRGMREAFRWVSDEVDLAVDRALSDKTLEDLLCRIQGS